MPLLLVCLCWDSVMHLSRVSCVCVCVFQLTLTTFCRLTADLRRWRRCGHRALICYRVTVPAKQLDLRISSHPPAYSFFKLFSTINYSWHIRLHRVSICIQRPPPMIPWTPPCVFLCVALLQTHSWLTSCFFHPTNKWKGMKSTEFLPTA